MRIHTVFHKRDSQMLQAAKNWGESFCIWRKYLLSVFHIKMLTRIFLVWKNIWKCTKSIHEKRVLQVALRVSFIKHSMEYYFDYGTNGNKTNYIPPKWILNMANRLILNIPNVHPKHASIELRPWLHCPKGLSDSWLIS